MMLHTRGNGCFDQAEVLKMEINFLDLDFVFKMMMGPNQPGPQGEPLGPPLNSAPPAHGPPDGQSVPHHPAPMELDMYQNQRPPYFDDIGADSHLHGDADMGPYGQPLGVDTCSMRMTAATKHPSDRNKTSRTAAAKHPFTAAAKHP